MHVTTVPWMKNSPRFSVRAPRATQGAGGVRLRSGSGKLTVPCPGNVTSVLAPSHITGVQPQAQKHPRRDLEQHHPDGHVIPPGGEFYTHSFVQFAAIFGMLH